MHSSEFYDVYRGEHRVLRNILLELAGALETGPAARIEELIQRAIGWTGARLQYREEALFPAVQGLVGHAGVRSLIKDHDQIVNILGTISDLTQIAPLTSNDRVEAATLVRSLLPALTRSYGLDLVFDLLSDDQLKKILAARACSLRKGTNLLEWNRSRHHPVTRGDVSEDFVPYRRETPSASLNTLDAAQVWISAP